MSNGKKDKKKGNKAGTIAFGVSFLVLSSIFKIHGLIGLGVILALSSFVSGIFRTMAEGLDLTTKSQRRQQEQERQQREQLEAEMLKKQQEQKKNDPLEKIKGETGHPEADELLAKGRQMIREIREENAKIPDESLTKKLDTLERLCSEIFRAVYEKPSKAQQIRKFMDYYLPTTLKMVKSYRMLGERSLAASDVEDARRRIDDALGVVTTGCRKMLNNLYKDDMLDIATDIDVLEQMLKRDGLTENDLELAAEQAKQAAHIDMAAQAAKAQRQQSAAAASAAAAPSAPTMKTDSGVQREMEAVKTEAAQHMPQVPTISGEMFPTYDGQATAQAKQK